MDVPSFNPRQTRVLLTGQTGVDHDAIMRDLKKYMVDVRRIPSDEIAHYELEQFLPDGVTVPRLLDARATDHAIGGLWLEAYNNLCEKIVNEDARFVIVSMHATWFRSSRVVRPIDLHAVVSFGPSTIVTIIDDLYSIWHRVKTGTRKYREPRYTGSYFTLREIAEWRWAEVMMTDSIAQITKCQNYLVGAKHPVCMLYKLLAERTKHVLAYACVPITDTRSDEQRRAEVNAIRKQLHDSFVLFDPLALDDNVLAIQLETQYGFANWHGSGKANLLGKKLQVREADGCDTGRWPAHFADGEDYVPLCTDPDVIEVDAGEAVEVCRSQNPRREKKSLREIQDSVIANHIRLRDYRLIADVQALPAYRPLYKGKQPGGQRDEITFAIDLGSETRCDVRIYEDPNEDGPIGGVFPKIAEPWIFSDLEEWWKRLRELRP